MLDPMKLQFAKVQEYKLGYVAGAALSAVSSDGVVPTYFFTVEKMN
jgi:hypothetical protein